MPPKNQKVGAQIYTKGERSGQGYFPPSGGRVWGGGCAPPQKICEIFAWKWRILVAFFAIREIFHLSCLFWSWRIFFRKQMVKIPWLFHDSLHFPWLAKIPWLSMTVGTMSESWGISRHAAWCTSATSAVSQCKLVTAWGLTKRTSATPYRPYK